MENISTFQYLSNDTKIFIVLQMIEKLSTKIKTLHTFLTYTLMELFSSFFRKQMKTTSFLVVRTVVNVIEEILFIFKNIHMILMMVMKMTIKIKVMMTTTIALSANMDCRATGNVGLVWKKLSLGVSRSDWLSHFSWFRSH